LDALYLKTGWGERNYMDLEVKRCSKGDITVPSLLAPTLPTKTTVTIALILKNKE